QRQAEKRRRMLAVGGVAVVLAVIIVVVIFAALNGSHKQQQAAARNGPLPPRVQADLTGPARPRATVGAGTALPGSIKPVTGPALASGGKPEMLYIGAEWCPYCAAERWAMAVALNRFGTFSPLKGIHSSATDVFPNTATLTFHQAKYTS